MAHHLNIDLETYSSVEISKAGLYKYVEAPDFQILLLAYSLDGGPVEVIDLAGRGDRIPPWLKEAVRDPEYIKHAYNAAFEWYCLCRCFGWDPLGKGAGPLAHWRCTMLHGLYCGYPGGLAAIGRALGLPEDKRKMQAGKALIRNFCTPCAPTQRNGGRTRNRPHHDPEKWALFVEYNRQDVVTEMEIEARLAAFPVPEEVQAQWVTDMIINARGVALDQDLVAGALGCSAEVTRALTREAVALTGLDNPNSVAQLRAWLEEETGEAVADLKKDTVKDLLGKEIPSAAAQRMLELRREMGKTSVKKYAAMEAAVCGDGRVRGLLQFYGANRTGRWAGRLVQVQNLPRTYLSPLDLARELVKRRDAATLGILYGSVPDALSQLIRTAFVAPEGKLLVDADFSAIEARVISWLAGEEWRLEVFRTHGKIYEASAAQMFGVPMETISKGRENYGLRQKGKVAELALGYQGSCSALVAMGALGMGLAEEELPDIVRRWRESNRRIRDLWYAMEGAAVEAVRTGRPQTVRGLVTFARELSLQSGLDYLTMALPSGRKLYYAKPGLVPNRWGGEAVGYWGVNQASRKWGPQETYGGRLTENCVQAIARDCLAEAVQRLEAAGFPVVFHIHDEMVCEAPEATAPEALEQVIQTMAQPIQWAPGLPLGADGWTDRWFRKD